MKASPNLDLAANAPPCAVQVAPLFVTLMQRALELIRGCGCAPDTGCPGCVQHTECGEYNAVISKACTHSS